MAVMNASTIAAFDTLAVLRGSFDAALAARNRAPKTRKLYGEAIASAPDRYLTMGCPTACRTSDESTSRATSPTA